MTLTAATPRRRRAAGRHARRPVPRLPVRRTGVLARGRADQRRRHPHHRQPGRRLGVPLWVTTVVFAVALGVTFAVWYRVERTLSIHSITTTRREAFYWLAILFTFALGTAAGDLLAEGLGLGYLASVAAVRRRDRRRRARALPVRARRRAVVLDRVRPDPSARRLDRRPALPAQRRRRPRPRHDDHEPDLPGRDRRHRRLPVGHPARRRARRSTASTSSTSSTSWTSSTRPTEPNG